MTTTTKSRVQIEAENLLREGAKLTGPASTPVPIPLDYGLHQPAHQKASNNVNAWIDYLGGWHQAGFATGLAFALGGLGYCIARTHAQADGAWVMAFGGLLIGFALPVPRKGQP
jgi:hypothetical protein